MSHPPAPIRLRAAAPSDLDGLAGLERRGFPLPWTPRSLAAELAEGTARLLVAEAGTGGELLGYLALRRFEECGEILRLTVAPERRGEGIARRLVEAALETLRRDGCRDCRLEVRPDNRSARRLYRALGFRPAGRRPSYYADGCDALILHRALV